MKQVPGEVVEGQIGMQLIQVHHGETQEERHRGHDESDEPDEETVVPDRDALE